MGGSEFRDCQDTLAQEVGYAYRHTPISDEVAVKWDEAKLEIGIRSC